MASCALLLFTFITGTDSPATALHQWHPPSTLMYETLRTALNPHNWSAYLSANYPSLLAVPWAPTSPLPGGYPIRDQTVVPPHFCQRALNTLKATLQVSRFVRWHHFNHDSPFGLNPTTTSTDFPQGTNSLGGPTRSSSTIIFGTLPPHHLASISRPQMQSLTHRQSPLIPNCKDLFYLPRFFRGSHNWVQAASSHYTLAPLSVILPWEIPAGHTLAAVTSRAWLPQPSRLAPLHWGATR